MTVPNEQQVLREAYDRCLWVKRWLQASPTIPDGLIRKTEELADAIHHYIVPKE